MNDYMIIDYWLNGYKINKIADIYMKKYNKNHEDEISKRRAYYYVERVVFDFVCRRNKV